MIWSILYYFSIYIRCSCNINGMFHDYLWVFTWYQKGVLWYILRFKKGVLWYILGCSISIYVMFSFIYFRLFSLIFPILLFITIFYIFYILFGLISLRSFSIFHDMSHGMFLSTTLFLCGWNCFFYLNDLKTL